MSFIPKGWWREKGWIRQKPAYVAPFAPPSMDAAENLKYTIWLVNHPEIPMPYPWRCNSCFTRLEDMRHDLPSCPIPLDEVLDVPY